jgi:hypothetical protein
MCIVLLFDDRDEGDDDAREREQIKCMSKKLLFSSVSVAQHTKYKI